MNEIRIGILGNVDSGKSTIISVLKENILDNGRGLARRKILKHKHEQETGRTSSITHHYYVNKEHDKILSFIDLPYIFVKRIKIFNNILTNKQINNIEKNINFNNNINNKQILLEEQIKKAVFWCNLYNITINRFSNYIE